MKTKTVIIGVVLIAVIVLSGVGIYVYSSRNAAPEKKTTQIQSTAPEDQVIPTIAPSDIGLTLSLSQSGKFAGHAVVAKISKLDGIASIECELTYTAKGNLPRGAICKTFEVKSSATPFEQELPFGTCSDKCHFDEDVRDVKMVFKITKTDNKVYQTEAKLDL